MDKSDLQRQVESLRFHLKLQRVPVSKAAADLKKYIEEHQQNDALVVPIDKKTNPWAEKGKCAIVWKIAPMKFA